MKKIITNISILLLATALATSCAENNLEQDFKTNIEKARNYYNKPVQHQIDLDSAVIFYTQAINIDSSQAIAFYERSLVYDQNGEIIKRELFTERKRNLIDSLAGPYYLKAISDLNKAIYLDPTNPVYYRARAYFYRGSRHYNLNKAISDFNKALQLNPKDYDCLISRGRLNFYTLKDSSSAFLDFQEAIKLDPKNYKAYQDWGNCLYECGSYYEAIQKYRMNVKLRPLDENGPSLHSLIKAQLAAGDYFAVIANCERMREYKPDWAEAYQWSAEAKIKLGLIDIGKEELFQAHKKGIRSDLYYQYFGTEQEKSEYKKNKEDWEKKHPNTNKWPLDEDYFRRTDYK